MAIIQNVDGVTVAVGRAVRAFSDVLSVAPLGAHGTPYWINILFASFFNSTALGFTLKSIKAIA